MFTKVALAFVLISALSACTGGDDKPSTDKPTASDSSPTPSGSFREGNPPCAEIWRDGGTLPLDYEECGRASKQQTREDCKDGTSLFVWDERYFGITGGKITESPAAPLEDTEAYGKAYAACTG